MSAQPIDLKAPDVLDLLWDLRRVVQEQHLFETTRITRTDLLPGCQPLTVYDFKRLTEELHVRREAQMRWPDAARVCLKDYTRWRDEALSEEERRYHARRVVMLRQALGEDLAL